MCDHKYRGLPDGMRCVREELRPGEPPHEPGRGCIYRSSTGSDVPDRHDSTSGGEH